MKLTKVVLAGYRSISSKVTLVLDPVVTVLLGANDHGKTNLLDALTHLNEESKLEREGDLNWDQMNDVEFPNLSFEFELDKVDRQGLLAVAQEKRKEEAAKASSAPPTTAALATTGDPNSPVDPLTPPRELTIDDVPEVARCFKKGVGKARSFLRAEHLPDGSMTAFMAVNMPRVELIRTRETVPDSTTLV